MRARNEPPHPLPKKRVNGLSGGRDSIILLVVKCDQVMQY